MQRAAPTDVHLVLDKYLSLASRAPLPPLSVLPFLAVANQPILVLFEILLEAFTSWQKLFLVPFFFFYN